MGMKTKNIFYGPINTIHFVHEHGAADAISLPHTEQVLHLYNAWVDYRNQDKGEGSKYHKERLNFLEQDDKSITLLTCVVNLSNVRQLSILKNNGWKKVYPFKSNRDERKADLGLFVRDIPSIVNFEDLQMRDEEDDI